MWNRMKQNYPLLLLVVTMVSILHLNQLPVVFTLAWRTTTTTTTRGRRLPRTCGRIPPYNPVLYPRLQQQQQQQQQQPYSFMVVQALPIFHGPEFDENCDEEEGECEINWDLMPGGDEEEAPEPMDNASRNHKIANTNIDTNNNDNNTISDNTKSIDKAARPLQNSTTTMHSSRTMGEQLANNNNNNNNKKKTTNSVNKVRVQLEMNWQIQECEQDEDSCEDFCPDCSGSGTMSCRFCRGTKTLTLNNKFATCPICQQGKEPCQACRGTGWIAPWATTMMNKHDDKK